MVVDIINKILTLFLILSILNLIKNIFNFALFWLHEKGKYIIDKREVLILGVGLSYIITVLINGVKI